MSKLYRDLNLARAAALKASLDNAGKYVILVNCFGLEVVIKSRLDPRAPSDAFMGARCYWLNGKEKKFTDKQESANDKCGWL